MTDLQEIILTVVTSAGPKGIALGQIAEYHCGGKTHSARRATARSVLRRLGAEGLVESPDGGESWRRVEG
jgi:hypothetical protein